MIILYFYEVVMRTQVHIYCPMSVRPTARSIGCMTAPAVDRGPVPEYQLDRRRLFGGSCPPEENYFPSGP